MNNKVFTSIVISGGAMKVLAATGCIKYLQENSLMQYVRNFVGTSAGAVLCLMLVLGYKYNEIIPFLQENLNDPEINTLDVSQFLNVLDDFGMNAGDNFVNLFRRILHKRTRMEDINFIDLAKMTGKNLVISGSNLTDEKEEFFCVDLTPEMSVITAMRITCSIPIIFNPVHYNDKIYLDGAFYNNFPINYFKDTHLKDILGINISFSEYRKTDNILNYLLYMVFSLVNKVSKMNSNIQNYENESDNVIMINLDRIKWIFWDEMKIGIPDDKVDHLIETGYSAMQQRFGTVT